jgi:hypothetical protein
MPNKPITFGRYQKVEAILEADRAIKAKLGPKTEIVLRPPPSNEKAFFSKLVVYITETLHASGVDAHTTSKTDVLRLALKLLQEGDNQFIIPELARPAAEPAPASKPKPDKPKPKASKPKAPVMVKPAVRKPGAGVVKATPAAKPAESKKASPKGEPAPVRSQLEAGSSSGPPERSKSLVDPSFPLAYGVSIVTLLMTVDQIMEAHDHSPGRKERQKKVADLIRECQSLTIIPKSAKEASPSTE